MGFWSDPITTYSKRQTIVSLSTTESELAYLWDLWAETTLNIWVLGLINDLGYMQYNSVILYEENKVAITILSSNFTGAHWDQTRNYGLRYEVIKSHIEAHINSIK